MRHDYLLTWLLAGREPTSVCSDAEITVVSGTERTSPVKTKSLQVSRLEGTSG